MISNTIHFSELLQITTLNLFLRLLLVFFRLLKVLWANSSYLNASVVLIFRDKVLFDERVCSPALALRLVVMQWRLSQLLTPLPIPLHSLLERIVRNYHHSRRLVVNVANLRVRLSDYSILFRRNHYALVNPTLTLGLDQWCKFGGLNFDRALALWNLLVPWLPACVWEAIVAIDGLRGESIDHLAVMTLCRCLGV